MRLRYKILSVFAMISCVLFIVNASVFAPTPDASLTLMSHRGVHQEFNTAGVKNDTCTAERIFAPTHNFMENTLSSMRAALDYGANMIELDIHPTTDGEFAVFHDWTLDCRTNGTGKVRDHSSTQLKALDIGYGYTSDDGLSFPFRGQFFGAMPMLGEVLSEFPDTRFLINIKSRSEREAQLLDKYLRARDISTDRIVIYGHQDPINVFKALNPMVLTMSKQQAKDCLVRYIATGWFGRVPETCRNTWVPVPENYRWIVWGWPNRLQERMSNVGSEVVLLGPFTKARSNPAIDTIAQAEKIPMDFGGTVWTNRIELIGPVLNGSNQQ